MVRDKIFLFIVCVLSVGLNFAQASDRKMFVLEGNGGAGKSTLLGIIKDRLAVDVIFEPVEKWQAVGSGGNLFESFFKDPSRWALSFQSYVLVSRVQTILDHQKSTPVNMPQILERSIYCDCFCFAKNCYESGFMTAVEWKVYQDWFSLLIQNYTQKPSGFIYLRTSPKVCFERVKKRGRSEEAGFNLEFLTNLHNRHEDWLVNKIDLPDFLKDVPVLIIDCDQDFEQDEQRQKKMLEEIANFMNVSSL